MFYRIVGFVCLVASSGLAQQSGRLVVTAEPKDNHPIPVLQRDDIAVEVDRQPARVQSWTPLTGNAAALQLFLVIDDADSTGIGIQFGDLKNFINAQPPSTQIGIAYLRYGSALIASPPTADHAAAAKALRLPFGEPGIEGSPYVAVQDLIKKWPSTSARREMLVIMSGIDPYYMSPDMFDPYLQDAVSAAQKANVVISSIYYSGAGHFGHSFYRTTWGQNYLSMLDEDTGGEYYWQGLTNPVSFQPFLKEYADWLGHQYLLVIDADYSGKPQLKPVRVTTQKPGVSLFTASKVYLEPGQPRQTSSLR